MLNRCKFSVGDHVYQELSSVMRHGIILNTYLDDDETDWILTILIFTGNESLIVVSPAKQWIAVQYGANESQVQTSRAGTCTTAKSDLPEKVLARAKFLQNNRKIVKKICKETNSECYAKWCKTGTFDSLNTMSSPLPGVLGVGGLTVATLVPAITVPSAGLWGFLGFTTQVSLMTVAPPFVVTALLVFAAAVVTGVPAIVEAKLTTMQKLNEAFAKYDADQINVSGEGI